MRAEAATQQATADYHKLKKKYARLKTEQGGAGRGERLATVSDERTSHNRETKIYELQQRVQFYQKQTEDLRLKLKQDGDKTQAAYESALAGGVGYRQAFEACEQRLLSLQGQMDHANALKEQVEAEVGHQRQLLERRREDLDERERQMRREMEGEARATKATYKAKFRAKMEGFERVCTENMQRKVQEVERLLQEHHTRELQSVAERVEMHYQGNYVGVAEHEAIVQEQLAKEAQANQGFVEELKRTKEAEIIQAQNDLQDKAQQEQQRLSTVVRTLENQLQAVQDDFRKTLDQKDRHILELQDKRTKDEVAETRELFRAEAQLRSQLLESAHQVRILEGDLARQRQEQGEQSQEFVQREQQLLQEAEQARLELEEASANQQAHFEAKYQLDQLEKANAALESKVAEAEQLLSQRQAEADAAQRGKRQFKARVTWLVSTKAAEVRSLKSELACLSRSLQGEVLAAQQDLEQKTVFLLDSVRRFERQLAEKDSDNFSMQQRFEAVLQQLEQAIQAKDRAQSDILELTTQRERLQRDVERLDSVHKGNSDEAGKAHARLEHEKSQAQALLAEEQVKNSRLEDRAAHLGQMIEKVEERNKELLVEVNALQQQRERDGAAHQQAMTEQEKRLQELFYTKLDKKVTKVAEEKNKEIDMLAYHQQQEVNMLQ